MNGKRSGTGVYYDTDGSTFSGEWANDVANGRGKFVDEAGVVSEGMWKNNEKVD